ncbi:hypothetical protein Lal_00000942 [Lupinus albus]|nr:hypothetical protein Lal_00000942 [Lupinus albus]
MTNIVLYGGNGKDPRVGGGVGGTSAVTKNPTQHSPRNKGARTGQMKRFTKRNEAFTSNQKISCFECDKLGHMKMDCPNIKKCSFKGTNEMKNGRRAYISWEDNDSSSASQPESEEQAHLSLMASHHSDDEEFLESKTIFSISRETTCYNNRLLYSVDYSMHVSDIPSSSLSCNSCSSPSSPLNL